MAYKLAAVLCLTLAVVAKASDLPGLTADLSAKENSLNCLLGKSNCYSPPPPSSPPPSAIPPSAPPTEPPVEPPTTPEPSPSEAPAPEPSLEPVPEPALAPAPVTPAPAPEEENTGTAVVVVSLAFPAGFVVTDDVRNTIAALIQAQLPAGTTVTLQVSGGRKLLEVESESLVITGVTDCTLASRTLETYVPTSLPSDVQNAKPTGYPLQSASLNAFACAVAGSPPFPPIVGPPATAPGPGSL